MNAAGIVKLISPPPLDPVPRETAVNDPPRDPQLWLVQRNITPSFFKLNYINLRSGD